jgi:hypothetical protein
MRLFWIVQGSIGATAIAALGFLGVACGGNVVVDSEASTSSTVMRVSTDTSTESGTAGIGTESGTETETPGGGTETSTFVETDTSAT